MHWEEIRKGEGPQTAEKHDIIECVWMILEKQAMMGGLIPAPASAPAFLAGWRWEYRIKMGLICVLFLSLIFVLFFIYIYLYRNILY